MTKPSVPTVPGAAELAQWFGRWPSFHDAEVLEVTLRRSGESYIRVSMLNVRVEVGADGQHYTSYDHHAVVTFLLEEVSDLELADFSAQNVIFGLDLLTVSGGYRIALQPCYGLAGYIEAAQVSVSFEPSGLPVE